MSFIKELTLLPDANGNEVVVKINTRLTTGFLRKAQNEGLLSKKFINNLMMMKSKQEEVDYNDMINSPYLAYLNQNPLSHITKEEFDDKLPFDLKFCAEIYGEIIQGQSHQQELAKGFQRGTKKK